MARIIAIVGSLRKDSFNKKLLRAAIERCPEGSTIEELDWSAFPVFNQDLEENFPEVVSVAKTKIRSADAVLIVTPEYNFSIPGPLKNMIDWCSRPYGDSAWEGKPVAVMGATPTPFGTTRAQVALRQSFVFLNMHPVQMPELFVSAAHEKFDEAGKLVDEDTGTRVTAVLEALINLTERLKT